MLLSTNIAPFHMYNPHYQLSNLTQIPYQASSHVNMQNQHGPPFSVSLCHKSVVFKVSLFLH